MILFILATLATIVLSSEVDAPNNCDTTIKGVFAKKASEFETSFNRLRNEVAQGRSANHKGKTEYAANMHIVQWSQGLSNGAQNCAERCPDSLFTCRNLQGAYGALSKFRTVHSTSIDWDPKEILNKWMEKPDEAEQLVVAMVFKFGCGRALKKNIDKYIEYIVCFFDQMPKSGVLPYIVASEKTIASACRLGKSDTYSGLCASPFAKMMIHTGMQIRSEIKLLESIETEQQQILL